MAIVCIASIAVFVLAMIVCVICACILDGRDDDELEQKYGIRRS